MELFRKLENCRRLWYQNDIIIKIIVIHFFNFSLQWCHRLLMSAKCRVEASFSCQKVQSIFTYNRAKNQVIWRTNRLAFNHGFLWEFGFDDFVITLKFLIVGKGWIKLRFSQHLLVFNLFRPSRCSLSLSLVIFYEKAISHLLLTLPF